MLDQLPSPETLLRFGLNISAMLCLIFGLYYRRYRDKELVTAASLFNVFAFWVLTALSSVEFSITAGFGLFAILALFTLRPEQISKIEITYFFGSIAIAVICSLQGTTLMFTAIVVAIVILGAWVLDPPRILSSAHCVKITLDEIDTDEGSHRRGGSCRWHWRQRHSYPALGRRRLPGPRQCRRLGSGASRHCRSQSCQAARHRNGAPENPLYNPEEILGVVPGAISRCGARPMDFLNAT